MFVGDYHGWLPPPEPEPDPAEPRRLSPRQQRVLARLVGFNLMMVLVAPIGGATLLQPLLAWLCG